MRPFDLYWFWWDAFGFPRYVVLPGGGFAFET